MVEDRAVSAQCFDCHGSRQTAPLVCYRSRPWAIHIGVCLKQIFKSYRLTPTPDSRVAASSLPVLQEHGIARVLSLVQPHEAAHLELNSQAHHIIKLKTIAIDDDPTVDILEHLENACDWIQEGLQESAEDDPDSRPGVLVHCRLGVSRSGSFIVAYCKTELGSGLSVEFTIMG